MSENKSKQKLFQEFPPVSTEAWEEKIQQDLKGKSYEKKLVWKTPEGFNVRPYYRLENLKNLNHPGYKPGEFPFVRGNKTNHNNWYIRQDIVANQPQAANKKALDILNKGITSLGFILNKDADIAEKDFRDLIKDICLQAIEINFINAADPLYTFNLLKEKTADDNLDPKALKASFDFAPLAELVTRGGIENGTINDAMEKASALITASRGFQQVRMINVHGEHYHNAGATLVQELAFALAEGAAYLTELTERGHSVDEVAKSIKFNFAVGSVYFMEIAKIRAARLLWSKIVAAYAPKTKESAMMNVHSITSEWNKTVYDPYVNMIRTSTEAMSAVIGGAESLTVQPYDKIYRKPSPFSERIARNQQIILQEESHLDKVADPAGGAYYIENLTNALAENAWNIFLEVQDKGGFTAAFQSGMVQEKVKESARNRDMNLATRKKILLGTNQYPNAQEVMDEDIPESVMEPRQPETVTNPVAEPLIPYRGAMKFESMRLKTDRSNKRPKVFMLKVGQPAMRTARSQFAANFFGCAGYEILDNLGFDSVEEGVKEAKEKQADIVVICSSDEEYPTLAPKAYNALKDDAIFVLAGYPADHIETLQNAGIENFIHIKSNLYETLKAFQQKLGIA